MMQKVYYEIHIIDGADVTFIKKYLTKTDAINHYIKIPKINCGNRFPRIQFLQLNYDLDGNLIYSISLKKKLIDINKIDIENAKSLLSK